ncbi:MAG TPA: DUF58 domain-containing protein [Thermoanaerobaculia bacterium]|nr:DUF58 domain-containing protein [Thermoanaerobaculia bacterium]
MRPTRRAILAAALGLPIALLPVALHARLWPFWPVYLGVFALALGVDALLSPRRKEVAVAAELPPLLSIGEAEEARLTVQLPSPRPVPVSLAVDLSDKLAPQGRLHGRASRDGAVFACPLVATLRGEVAVERVWVRYTGPLGLMASVVRQDLWAAAAVVPNLRPVRTVALRFANERDFRAGLKIERYTGDGTEFDSLREYAFGDDRRAVDWKASARHGKPIARQFRAERNHQIVFAIDTGHLMSEPLGGVPKLDHAVTAALLLSYVSLRAGDRVGWITFDARVGREKEPAGGMRAFQELNRFATGIEYSDLETNFTLGLTTLAQGLHRRSLVVVLTDFVDTITAELMLENLGRLARRHSVLFVTLRDPDLAAVAARAPGQVLDLHRAVVADGLLRDREVVLRRLRRLGIATVDAEPARIGPRLINTYLEIKRRERI